MSRQQAIVRMYEIHVHVSRLTVEMHDGIIVRHSPSTGQSVDLLKCLLALSEDIESQRFLSEGKSEQSHLNNGIHVPSQWLCQQVCVCVCECVSVHV